MSTPVFPSNQDWWGIRLIANLSISSSRDRCVDLAEDSYMRDEKVVGKCAAIQPDTTFVGEDHHGLRGVGTEVSSRRGRTLARDHLERDNVLAMVEVGIIWPLQNA